MDWVYKRSLLDFYKGDKIVAPIQLFPPQLPTWPKMGLSVPGATIPHIIIQPHHGGWAVNSTR